MTLVEACRHRLGTWTGPALGATIPLIGFLDYITGWELSFSVFYLLPVLGVGWCNGREWALTMAILGAFTWGLVDHLSGHQYTHWGVLWWNAGVRLVTFIVAGLAVAALRHAVDVERSLARTDPLTGLQNNRSFHEHATLELERLGRARQPLSVAYLDLDGFKGVNDRFGHRAGDALLRDLGQRLREGVRLTDVAARVGGDEFVVILPHTDERQAVRMLERLRASLDTLTDPAGGRITVSVGVVTFLEPPPTVEELLRAADELMYRAKRGGKDRVVSEAR